MSLRPLRPFGIPTLYTGPMTAGKSDDLINDLLRREEYGKQRGLVYRPSASRRDDQDIQGVHTSRNGAKVPCAFFDSLEHLKGIVDTSVNVIGIDEIHFLNDAMPFVRFVERIQARGQDVLLGGVDTDFMGQSFPVVAAVMNLDGLRLRRLEAWCTVCGFEARWSQLMGEPPKEGGRIQKGYHYEARCTEHFEPRQFGT